MFFPFSFFDDAGSDAGGQGGGSPDAGKKGDGQDKLSPDQGTPEERLKKKEEEFNKLHADYTRKSQTLKKVENWMGGYRYKLEEIDKFTEDHDGLLSDAAKSKKTPDDGGGGDDDKGSGGEGAKKVELPDEIKRTIATSSAASVKAVRTTQWMEFEKNAEKDGRKITPEIKQKLDDALNEIAKKAPAFLEGTTNWYGDAETWLIRRDPEYRRAIEKAAIEKEDKRRKDAGGGEHFAGGAKAGGGTDSDAMKELKKKVGAAE